MVTSVRMTHLRGDKRMRLRMAPGRCALCGHTLGRHPRVEGRAATERLCLACLTELEELLRNPAE